MNNCVKCVHIENYAKMQCIVHALKTAVKKLCVAQWTLQTLSDFHIGDVVEAMSHTCQFQK